MITPHREPQPLSRGKRFLFSLIVFSLSTLLCLLLAEAGLRKKGYSPWVSHPLDVTVEPARDYYAIHPTLGYASAPGEFKVTLPGPYTFKTTHLSGGLRVTHPLSTYPGKAEKEIWVFGCSFTHGWSLNDEETYPWLLQERLPGYEVVNFGVDGYGTLQSLIQFREGLEGGKKPVAVVLAYASFHDQRNTLTRAWVKTMLTYGNPQGLLDRPYARLNGDGRIELLHGPVEYHEFPLLRRSALINYLDEAYNGLLEGSYHSHEVSRALIEDFASLCKANGVEFVVAGIFSDPATADMLERLNGEGVLTVDISVDLGLRENNNLPYDNHPSAAANEQFAQKLRLSLCDKLPYGPPCDK